MRTWFNSRPWARRTVRPDGAPVETAPVARADLDEAYQKGRRDGSRRRRGSPFLGFLGLLAIIAVGVLIYLAAQTGSFSGGGAVVDNNISNATQRIQAPVKQAADNAGAALENAGQKLKRTAGDQPANP